ncbi:hypothetical protein COT75_04045 [Candidatus Beckwithbacteria bacterium CG10_big_fil_rev_8_21_14_0_10_34_10]|uniref:Uncharacterized protein n=1 Tax=Candidatus Beckwithbacteria bacterium CG10_big_fil_rev_8_21_14_0_10_34_10 TaxID=1974495 RepID=A0A2H0W8K9_9BACT|nr:MAG: hypothetical protein COT75_04045 [Candidatus Beckwithbacteria bacterium CG10_big_fil_rev_8_21_14_0_10_34_10]
MSERILFLLDSGHSLIAKDYHEELYAQLLPLDHLRPDINTDELFPAKRCLFFEELGDYLLTGDRHHLLAEGDVKAYLPTVLVGGENFGCGSAREHPQIGMKNIGIELIIAPSFDTTFRNNCTAMGILTSTDTSLAGELLNGDPLDRTRIMTEFQGIEGDILSTGGLLNYTRERLKGIIPPLEITTGPRPMTMAEKIIANHLSKIRGEDTWVKPGDQAIIPVDSRMSYEVFTPLIASLLKENLAEFPVSDPASIFLFADHFVENIGNPNHPVNNLLLNQSQFSQEKAIVCHTDGIGHNLMIERFLLPGQLAIGTDSHSSMWGALGTLGIPVGATSMAAAFISKDHLITVPSLVRIDLKGNLPSGCSARDISLYLSQVIPLTKIRGKIIEFRLDGQDWNLDELAVLTCTAKEMGALTAIIEPNETIIEFLKKNRKLAENIEDLIVKSDPEAKYDHIFSIQTREVEPMIALPGNPNNTIPISELEEKPIIDKAYIGGCVGGKLSDLISAAKILKGKKINPETTLFVQPATRDILEKATQLGIVKILSQAGAIILNPNCGACIGQGQGRIEKGEIGIYNTTRNYPGRVGEGEVYLSSAETVASSAIQGRICSFEEI